MPNDCFKKHKQPGMISIPQVLLILDESIAIFILYIYNVWQSKKCALLPKFAQRTWAKRSPASVGQRGGGAGDGYLPSHSLRCAASFSSVGFTRYFCHASSHVKCSWWSCDGTTVAVDWCGMISGGAGGAVGVGASHSTMTVTTIAVAMMAHLYFPIILISL